RDAEREGQRQEGGQEQETRKNRGRRRIASALGRRAPSRGSSSGNACSSSIAGRGCRAPSPHHFLSSPQSSGPQSTITIARIAGPVDANALLTFCHTATRLPGRPSGV